MKKIFVASLFALVFALCSIVRAGPLDAVAPYVGGEWKIDAKWSGGEPLQARETYEWSVGKKFIIAKTYIATPKGEYQRYETIFGEQDGKLMGWSFVFDGSSDSNEFVINGMNLSSTKSIDGKSTLHQSIELTDPDKFRWVVGVEKDGKTETVMDGTWIRSKEVSKTEPHYAENSPSSDDALINAIAPLIGEWRIKSKWSDGRDVNARHVATWGPGKKFVACKTTLFKADDSVDYERYYTLFGVKDGKLTAFHFVFDGTTDFETMDVTGKRIGGVRTFKNPEGTSLFHQFIEFTDNDTMHWKVWTDKDGEEKPMMDSNWKRVVK